MHVRSRSLPADVITPISAYLALASEGASCLLESAETGDRISRYSFLGLDYAQEAALAGNGALFDAIRAFVEPFASRSRAAGFPGAALVAFSYDAARSRARLPEREPASPPMPAAYVALPKTWLIFDHYTDRLTIWSCDESDEVIGERLDRYVALLFSARPHLAEPCRAGEASASIGREDYLNLVRTVKTYIREGDCYQAQIGIRFAAGLLRGTPFDMYRAMRSRNPSPYMFFVDAPFGQVFGASPEFLVRLEGRSARIRPLAGTRPRGETLAEDAAIATQLLADEKERAEHVMLVDLARNDLGSVCEYGSVHVNELMKIERYSHVMHIVSDVTGTLRKDCDALDLFAASFPAGTVTGTPKIRAMQIVDELEPVSRGFYAGSVGRWDFAGNFDSCITLRSVHAANGRIAWQASAGIVADSVPEAEYDEVLHKTRIVRDVLKGVAP